MDRSIRLWVCGVVIALMLAIVAGNASAETALWPDAWTTPTTQTPFGWRDEAGVWHPGEPAPVPGAVEAENYDWHGWTDATPGNTGGHYRQDGVDITLTPDGGYAVGWTEPGEVIKHTVRVDAAGTYTLRLRAATWRSDSVVAVNGKPVALRPTNGMNDYMETVVVLHLDAGERVIETKAERNGAYNLDRIVVQLAMADPAPTLTPTPVPTVTPTPMPTGVIWRASVPDGADWEYVITVERLPKASIPADLYKSILREVLGYE